jgi:hypothetical protein
MINVPFIEANGVALVKITVFLLKRSLSVMNAA